VASAETQPPVPFRRHSWRKISHSNGKYLSGTTEMKPRWKRCVESTDQLLGEALGQKYVEKYFPPEAKARMQEMVRNLLAAMRDDILSRPWMSDDTKEKPCEDCHVQSKIGYPDKWKDYSHGGNPPVTPSLRTRLRGRKFVEQDDRLTIWQARGSRAAGA